MNEGLIDLWAKYGVEINGLIYGWVDGWVNRWMDRWMGR